MVHQAHALAPRAPHPARIWKPQQLGRRRRARQADLYAHVAAQARAQHRLNSRRSRRVLGVHIHLIRSLRRGHGRHRRAMRGSGPGWARAVRWVLRAKTGTLTPWLRSDVSSPLRLRTPLPPRCGGPSQRGRARARARAPREPRQAARCACVMALPSLGAELRAALQFLAQADPPLDGVPTAVRARGASQQRSRAMRLLGCMTRLAPALSSTCSSASSQRCSRCCPTRRPRTWAPRWRTSWISG